MTRKVPLATLVLVLMSLSSVSALSPALGDTFYGPSLNVTPATVASGGSVTMQITTGSSSGFTAPPGPDPCNSSDPSTCAFPLQACDGSLNYYQINQATVTDPNNNQYMLGSAVTSGLGDPNIPSPRYTSAGFAPSINVSQTDSGSMPFGAGAGGFFALTSNLPNPPTNVNPEGPYYWWTVAGNVNGKDLRLDQHPSIQPTAIPGTYTYDLEGLVFCGTHQVFFDAAIQFTVSSSQAALNIVKTGTSSPNSCNSATGAIGSVENGGTIAYSVTISNSGSGAASGVVVTDPQPAGETFGGATASSPTLTQSGGAGSWSWTGTIAAGASVTISWTATVSTTGSSVTNVAMITSPSPSSTVTITGNPASCQTLVLSPAITVVKSVSPTTVDDLQDNTIAVSALVTNSGNAPLSAITIADTLSSNLSCPSATLAVGASETCTGTYVIPKGDSASSSTDTVTVTGKDSSGATVTGTSSATVTIIHPAITVVKSVNPTTVSNLQDNTITVSALVTNTGDTPLSGITISDTLSSNISCPSATLSAGASETCTGTYVIAKGTSPGSSTDTVTVTGTDSVGGEVTGTSSATVTITTSALTVVKSVSPTTVDDLQDNTISVSAVVTNSGGTTISGIAISDTLSTNMVCPSTSLAPGASMTCTGTYVIPKGDSASSSTDTVTVTGTDSLGNELTAHSSATVTITHPAITVVKTVSPTTVDDLKDNTITVSALVTNTGDTPLSSITIADTLSLNISCPSATLAAGASETCTGTYVIPTGDSSGSSTDTVTVTGTDSTGGKVTSNSSATVTITHPGISVVKTVTPTTVINNQDNTITVSALVTNTGDTPLSGITISDTLSSNISCPSAALGVGTSETCTGTYVIPKGAPTGSSTDTVTVTGTDNVGGTVTSTSTATVTITSPSQPALTTQVSPSSITITTASSCSIPTLQAGGSTAGCDFSMECSNGSGGTSVLPGGKVFCLAEDIEGAGHENGWTVVFTATISPAASPASVTAECYWQPSHLTGAQAPVFCTDNGNQYGSKAPTILPATSHWANFTLPAGWTSGTITVSATDYTNGAPSGTPTGIDGSDTCSSTGPGAKNVCTSTITVGPTTPPGTADDTATLSGGNNPTGTVTFTVYSDSGCTTPVAGFPGSSTTSVVAVNGNGQYTSAPFTPPGDGTYYWGATYSGDSQNLPITATCGPSATTEVLTVGPPACTIQTAEQTSIASNFNANTIAAGNYVWFNSVLKLQSKAPAGGLTLFFTNQVVTFKAGTTTYSLSVPNSEVIFSPTATTATTTFTGGQWVTTVPATFTDNVFFSGLAFLVPAGGLPGGINPVTWSGQVSGTATYQLQWQWGAAVYTSFTTNYNSLGVKPTHSNTIDAYHNGDQAGTPENYKSFVTGGARGGGGSNWTGSYSPTGSVSGTCTSSSSVNTAPLLGVLANEMASMFAGGQVSLLLIAGSVGLRLFGKKSLSSRRP